MGRNKFEGSRRKAPLGQGKRVRQERKIRSRTQKELQAQLGELHVAKKQKLKQAGFSADKSTGFADALQVQPTLGHGSLPSIAKFFWGGSRPEGEPDEELKHKRKSLGIKLRGSAAPAPVESFLDDMLPAAFGKFFKGPRGSKMSRPTPIQMQVWPAALCGLDVLGIAPTGSGKTLAYLLPAVPHVEGAARRKDSLSPICLVLLPTRELAAQVSDQFKGKGGLRQVCGIRAEAVYGGIGKEIQLDTILSSGCPQVLAATPGRLLDLLGLAALSLDAVTYLVLDEADRMLALGFEDQLDAIAKVINKDRQCLLFSATFPLRLREASARWMTSEGQVTVRVGTVDVGAGGDDVEEITAAGTEVDASSSSTSKPIKTYENAGRSDSASTLTVNGSIEQIVHVCAEHKKSRKLIKFLDKIRAEEKQKGVRQRSPVLIFCNKIQKLKTVVSFLCKNNHYCASLHSGIPQAKREQALSEFKAGRLLVLAATDVAARGLHVKHLSYVVNYDFPTNLEQYCHRIGRTGRDGESGTAFSFFTRNLHALSTDFVQLLERSGAKVDPNLRDLAEGRITEEHAGGDEDVEDAASEDDAASENVAASDDNGDHVNVGQAGTGGGLRIQPRQSHRESSSEEDVNVSASKASSVPGPRAGAQEARSKASSKKNQVKRQRGKRGGQKHKH